MAEQLALALKPPPDLTAASFVPGAANAQARALLEASEAWPAGLAVLTGPEGAGKTHLAAIWAAAAGARFLTAAHSAGELEALATGEDRASQPGPLRLVFDGAEDWFSAHSEDTDAQRWAFHLLQRVAGEGGSMLLTGRCGPAAWAIAVPDIASRLAAALSVRLEAPDDALLGGVLAKHFRDHGVRVEDGLIAYLVLRMERSLREAGRLSDALVAAAAERRRPLVTKALAREVLAALALGGGSTFDMAR